MLTGRVDNFQNAHLTGWAFNSESPGEHLVIRVNLGTQIIATGVANILRPDLPEAGIGAGDHAFRMQMPSNITSVNGLMVIAQSQKHGEVPLAVATNDDKALDALFTTFSERYDKSLIHLRKEVDGLKEAIAGVDDGQPTELPDDLSERLVRLETRMESAEIFFVRIDEMMRHLVDEKKKRRKRFLGML